MFCIICSESVFVDGRKRELPSIREMQEIQ